jgi:Flp pilus assembly protein TadG
MTALPLAPLTRLRLRARELVFRFRRDRSGVSAVEFALILPVMLLLYFGAVEIGEGVTISRKVTHVTSSLGDLVTQSRSISNNDMKNILDATSAIMNPYPIEPLTLVVSGVWIDDNGKATVKWSDARNRAALAKDSVITLPAQVSQKNTFLVVTEVHYDFKPTVGYVLSGTIDLDDQSFLRPRLTDTIGRVP